MAPKTRKIHAVGTHVLCNHNNVLYEAKIIGVKNPNSADPIYVIHYQGWHSRYNEEITHSESEALFSEATKDAVNEAKERRQFLELERNLKKKSKKSKLETDADGSRGSSPSEKTPSHASSRAKGLKRKATDSPALTDKTPSEATISLPKALKQILVDDYDLISKCYLYKLPAKYSIRKIVQEYIATLGVNDADKVQQTDVVIEYDHSMTNQMPSDMLVGSALMVNDYFDCLLGSVAAYMLLYKFERPQLAQLKDELKAAPPSKKKRAAASEEEDDFEPSNHYGLPHLLRMLSRMTSVLRLGNLSELLMNNIINAIHDFIVFLNKNHKKFHSEADYETAPPEYTRIVQLT